MAQSQLFPTQPLPFSRISGWVFYPPKNPPKEPDDIASLLYVGGVSSGYRPHLIQGELADGFLASVSCAICKGILNEPNQPILDNNLKTCRKCAQIAVPIDCTLTDTINTFIMFCPLYHRGCAWTGPIKSSIMHLNECSFIYVRCNYVQMGLCLIKQPMMKRELADHCKQAHAQIESIFNEVQSLKEKLSNSEQERRMLWFENRFLKQTYKNGEIIVQVLNFERRLGETFNCPIFQTPPPPLVQAAEGYSLQVILNLNLNQSVDAALTIRDGHCDDILPWPMLVNYKATIFSFTDDSLNIECQLLCSEVAQSLREKGSTQAPGWAPLATYHDIIKNSLVKHHTMYLMFNIYFI